MANQKDITLRPGEAAAKDIRLYATPVAAAPTTTIYLFAGEAAAGDIVLRDPTAPPEAASGDATAFGGTVTAASSLIDGASSGSAVQDGAVLPATVSLIDGAAAGAAGANGATLAVAASLIDGVATGAATTAADIVTATASLIAGAASGEAAEVAPPVVFTGFGGPPLERTKRKTSATAPGAVAATGASIIPGRATGAATASGTAPGAVAATGASIIPGRATGDAEARSIADHGSIIVSIRSGHAKFTPDAGLLDDDLLLLAA